MLAAELALAACGSLLKLSAAVSRICRGSANPNFSFQCSLSYFFCRNWKMVFVSFQHGCLCSSSVTPVCAISFSLLEIIIWKRLVPPSSWMSLDVGKQLLCFAVCFVKGMLSKVSSCQWKALLNSHGEWMRPLLCANLEPIMGETEIKLSQSRLPGPYPH